MTHDQPLAGKRAAVAVGPLYEEIEALYPLYRLREAGAAVQVIGAKAGTIVPGKRGDEIEVDRAAGDLSAGDLDLLVIAGGYGPDKLRMTTACSGSYASSMSRASRSRSSATAAGSRRRRASSRGGA